MSVSAAGELVVRQPDLPRAGPRGHNKDEACGDGCFSGGCAPYSIRRGQAGGAREAVSLVPDGEDDAKREGVTLTICRIKKGMGRILMAHVVCMLDEIHLRSAWDCLDIRAGKG